MAAKTGKKLKAVHRAFLTKQLACYASPKEAAEALREDYGIDITAQSAEHYDPTKHAGRSCAKQWRELFVHTRAEFLAHIDKHVPEANKAVRVRQLANASRVFKRANNYVGMADMLERIAKEVGNVHTNRREVTGKGGGPIKYQDIDLMTEDQVDDELRRYGFDPDVHPAPATEQ